MKRPTIKVPVSELAAVAEKAFKQMQQRADKKWNDVLDKEWENRKDTRWFWIGPLMYANKEEVEQLLGKVDKPSQLTIGTEFAKIYMATHQTDDYNDFIALMKNKPDSIVTLGVKEYNTLMTWDGPGKEEKTFV